jgi:DNA-binding CsgD family transcriptional regulator
MNLKSRAPVITQSEMRLAALIKLNLDNKQMASMQGISVSSLRGNKTRLRQKLALPPETDLDELIKSL